MLQKLTALLFGKIRRKKVLITCALVVILLLCGFSSWTVAFSSTALFNVEEAVDFDMVQNFADVLYIDEFNINLNSDVMAEQIISGVQANLASEVCGIEIPEMHGEPIGKKIVRIILDRLFN